MYKLRKFISLALIVTLMFGRVLVVLPKAAAIDIPSMPSVPTMPDMPTAPASIPPPPAVPTAPNISTSIPSVPVPPPSTGGSIPTAPALPTQGAQDAVEALPTNPAEPTEATANTTDSLADFSDTGNQTENATDNTTGNETGNNSSDQSTSNTSGSSGDESSSSGSVNDPANTNTGAASHNEAYENLEKKLEVMNENLAELQNKIDAVSNSGFNYANLNTLDGQVMSGDTQASVNLMNKLNSNMTGVGAFEVFNIYGTYLSDIVFQMSEGGASDSFSNASANVSKNVTTGPASTNIADSSNTFTVKEENGNDAKIQNDINLQSVTGENSASFNTGNGEIQTGNATAVGNVVNMANSNLNVSQWLWGVVNIFGTMLGNIILPQEAGNTQNNTVNPTLLLENSNTGPLSDNTANYENKETATFENANTADISNNLDLSANSGNNVSSANTGGGLVISGDSDVAVSDTTITNTNTTEEEIVFMVVVNEAGKWVGHILGLDWDANYASNILPATQTTVENSATGPLSDNTSSYSQTDNTTVANNNDAQIANNINVTADSGNNTATFNTGAGVIKTGDAKASLNVVNMSNTNVTAKKFIAVLVNVLGAWLGDVVTPGQQQTISNTQTESTETEDTKESADELVVIPTITPLPTLAPIGGTTSSEITMNDANDAQETSYRQQQIVSDDSFNTYTPQTVVNYVYPVVYTQAVAQVITIRRTMAAKKPKITAQIAYVDQQKRDIKRGLFLSPAFAKATEGTLPGMLLGGVSLKVNNSWLAIVPLALFIFLLRRRKKYNLGKYLNMLLSIVL